MTPEQAEGAMQFVADQQGNFAIALLKMQDQLEHLAAYARRLEGGLQQLSAKLDRLAEAAQRSEADRQAATAERRQLRQDIAELRTAIGAGRHAA